MYKSVYFWTFWPFIICIIVNLIPFESFAMQYIDEPFTEEEYSQLQNNESNEEGQGLQSGALQIFTGLQNQQEGLSNQPFIITQISDLYNNEDGYINTPRGSVPAVEYVTTNIKLDERFYSSGESLENRGLTHGAVLRYTQAFNRFSLSDHGMKIDLAAKTDPVLANELRSELPDIIDRQERELGPLKVKAHDEVIYRNPTKSIEALSALTKAKSAVSKTWNDQRFQTALSVAQGPLTALGVVGIKCAVEQYANNNA